MAHPLRKQMRDIFALTRAGQLRKATEMIQKAVGNRMLFLPDPLPEAEPAAPLADPVFKPRKRRSFRRHHFSSEHGSLEYQLYIPRHDGHALPLVVMLHGCKQDAKDFANGTQMNALADEMGFIVVYPEQRGSANANRCWNWFRPGDQSAGAGEPAMIAGIVQQVIAKQPVDVSRVYIAGLSAGGALTAIMADAYPDTFAAAAVHSGLAAGAARNVPGAFAAMQGKSEEKKQARRGKAERYVPTITFHGDEDETVHFSNAARIHAPWGRSPALKLLHRHVEDGIGQAGRRYRRTALAAEDGRTMSESWDIYGAGHAWSGGSPKGSYTDASGPDASREMLRFFWQHRLSKEV